MITLTKESIEGKLDFVHSLLYRKAREGATREELLGVVIEEVTKDNSYGIITMYTNEDLEKLFGLVDEVLEYCIKWNELGKVRLREYGC